MSHAGGPHGHYKEADILEMMLKWIGIPFRKGDFVEMRPPSDGEQWHRYYSQGEWIKAEEEHTFIGHRASDSFGKEGHIAGPISEFRLWWGTPGVMGIWIRVPKPLEDKVSTDPPLRNNPKVWTLLSLDMRAFWSRVRPEDAKAIRDKMMYDYELIIGGDDGVDKLTPEETEEWITCMERNTRDDELAWEDEKLQERIDREASKKFEEHDKS